MTLAADAITSALVHSLWQNTIVGLLVWVALVALRHRSANVRYVTGCVAMGAMVVLPVVTALVLSQQPVVSSVPTAIVATLPPGDQIVPREALRVGAGARSANWIAILEPWMLPLWLAGVAVCSIRLALASMHTAALRRQCALEQGPMTVMALRLAARMGIRRPIVVRTPSRMMVPATFGVFRPVILLPSATVLNISVPQLEAVLAHELAHIRRHDFLVNVTQMIAETAFFYHPAIWWISRRIRVERELCCDDIAVETCGDAVCYARALTSVAQWQVAQTGMALGTAGGPLVMRIQRVLGVASIPRPRPPLSVVTTAVAVVVTMFTAMYAQSPQPQALSRTDASDGAVLRGRIVDAATGKPLVGASVRAQYVTGIKNPTRCPIGDCEEVVDPVVGLIPVYRVTTGRDGGFAVLGMKPGDYQVAAVAPGYIQRYFGQTSEDVPELSVHVGTSQRTTSIDVELERAASVSGRILSDAGDGLAGVEVELLRRLNGRRDAAPIAVAFAQTEVQGEFGFRNVPAGEYYVRAYLDAQEVTSSKPVVVNGGQELTGVELALSTTQSSPETLPQFEVASIKFNRSEGPANYWEISGRRFLGTRSQVSELIRAAWGDFQLRIEGAPDWIARDRYDVIANAGVDIAPPAPALGQMIRALLIERFKLAAHLEPRAVPIYALVLARPGRQFGPRLRAPLAECALLKDGSMAAGACGPGVTAGRITFGNTTMDNLAILLSREVGRRVVNETGLTDGYQVDLEYVPQRLLAAPPTPDQAPTPPPVGMTVLDAVQEQLGLKLESRTGSVDVLVIDHIERPTPD